jgi:lipopolysaccharide/colanic/teichoic acid biosynthesis glycosyltransferase
VEYLELYTDREATRLHVLPGLTGWAQVNGRHSISFSRRLAYDAWYVENRSLALDTKIMLLTLIRLARRSGVAAAQDLGHVDDRGFSQLTAEARTRTFTRPQVAR